MKRYTSPLVRLFVLGLAIGLAGAGVFAATPAHKKKTCCQSRRLGKATVAAATAKSPTKRKVWVQTWDEPTYKDSTTGDKTAGEDQAIRKAAVEALGPLNEGS